MKKTLDSRLLTLLRSSNFDLYARLSGFAERNDKSRSQVILDAVLYYLTSDTDERYEYLLDIDKRIQTAKDKYRDSTLASLIANGADDATLETMKEAVKGNTMWPSVFE